MHFNEENTLELLFEGEEKTKSTIEKLINDPVREFKQQLYSSRTIFYYNKEKQEKNAAKLKRQIAQQYLMATGKSIEDKRFGSFQ